MNRVAMQSDVGMSLELLTRHKQGPVTIRLAYCGMVCGGVLIEAVARPMIREGELGGLFVKLEVFCAI